MEALEERGGTVTETLPEGVSRSALVIQGVVSDHRRTGCFTTTISRHTRRVPSPFLASTTLLPTTTGRTPSTGLCGTACIAVNKTNGSFLTHPSRLSQGTSLVVEARLVCGAVNYGLPSQTERRCIPLEQAGTGIRFVPPVVGTPRRTALTNVTPSQHLGDSLLAVPKAVALSVLSATARGTFPPAG